MLLETLDTEELLADGLFVVPWCSLRRASEGAKNRRFQFGLSAPRAIVLRHRRVPLAGARPRGRNG